MSIKIIEPRKRIHAGYVEPAKAKCTCGRIVSLANPLFNECGCGRWYNMCGQEKIDPNSELNRELDAESGEYYGRDY